jgi:hypothetical protein
MTNKYEHDNDAHVLSKQIVAGPIEPGDAGLVFKPDGTFYLFNTYTADSVAHPSDEQLLQMSILDAFSVAVQHPQILDVLIQMANDPGVRGHEPTPDFSKPKH